jgi:hypothetical protein
MRGEKKTFFNSVNSHSDNTLFFAADSSAVFMDYFFDHCFSCTFESGAGKTLINF